MKRKTAKINILAPQIEIAIIFNLGYKFLAYLEVLIQAKVKGRRCYVKMASSDYVASLKFRELFFLEIKMRNFMVSKKNNLLFV